MRAYAPASALLFLAGFASGQSQYEVASIRPNTSGSEKVTWNGPPRAARFSATNVNLRTLIKLAYRLKDSEIAGAPGWIDSDRYDIAASIGEPEPNADQNRAMLQALLADRFKLEIHRDTREIPVYALEPAKNGPRLPEAREGTCVEFGPQGQPPVQSRLAPCGGFVTGPNLLAGGRVSMAQFVDVLSNLVDRRVLDRTGFNGTFNVRLEFTPPGVAEPPADISDKPSLFTAVQEQLGLKLESQKAPAQVLVIDRVERTPTEN